MLMHKNKRVFLGVNHIVATDAEARCLIDLGFEVFVPKKISEKLVVGTLSVVQTYEYDATLTIPQKDLEYLNNYNFYDAPPTKEIIKIVNLYFDTMFFNAMSVGLFYWGQVFKGKIIQRGYGHLEDLSYEESFLYVPKIPFFNPFMEFLYIGLKIVQKIIRRSPLPGTIYLSRPIFTYWVNRKRFFLGAAYPKIIPHESNFLKSRSVFLPLGVPQKIWDRQNTWRGGQPRIMFFCANMEHPYYRNVLASFISNIGDLPHSIFGRQKIDASNPNIKGFLSQEEMDKALCTYACMFYHSREPRHLHYHPIEAIIHGMPLIFMAGGVLEQFGGSEQPGMAQDFAEAREKLRRILDGDVVFIEQIRSQQIKIIENLKYERIISIWKSNFPGVQDEASYC